MKRLLIATVLGLAASTAAPARAQTLDPDVFPIDMVTPMLNQLMLENALEEPSRPRRAKPGHPPAAAPPPNPAAEATTSATAYRTSPAVTARAKRQFLDFVARTDGPAAARRLEQVLARNDFVQNWSALVAPEGLRAGDLADVLASYWLLNYLIANGLTEGPKGTGPAVSRQVRGVMAGNPAFARLSEPQRQEMAEILMLNFLIQQAAYGDAVNTGNRDLKRRLGDAAVARFRNEMRVDLRRLQLTPAGFVRRG